MRRFAALSAPAALMLLVVPACSKDRTDPEPTGPSAPAALSVSASVSATDATAGDPAAGEKSSVCVAYTNARDILKGELANSPADAELADRLATAEEAILDSCN